MKRLNSDVLGYRDCRGEGRLPEKYVMPGTLARRTATRYRASRESADAWLTRSSANLEWVMGAYADALAGRGRVMTMEGLRREIGLDPS